MCGIVGFFDRKSKLSSKISSYWLENESVSELASHIDCAESIRLYDNLNAAMDTMAQRGPDDEGCCFMPGIGLGHRRLSVIDIGGGQQPFIDKDTNTAIVYNGEIYNFASIRKVLEAHGHTFRSQSDTEVILRAYIEWGENCLEHFSGMFAFAIFDPTKRRLMLARDRLGVKPLFYSIKGSKLFFASSITALRCFDEISSSMDLSAVSHYLTTIRTTFGRKTLLKDINTLLPGEFIAIEERSDTISPEKYWDIPLVAPQEKDRPGIDKASEKAGELMVAAVNEQLISDVPLGGFLSGGIDSSIIASLATDMTSGNYNAYSVGYAREGYNEWPFIRESVEFNKMTCREVHLSEEDYPQTWKELIDFKGLPIATPNEIAIYHLAKALKEDYTVALSGEGADEIFGGYTIPYYSSIDYERARRSAPDENESLSQLDRAIQRLYRRPYLLCRADHFFLINSWIPFNAKHRMLSNKMWDAINQDDEVFEYYESWFEKLKDCSTFDAYMQIHARVNLEGLLSRVDSSTMAASVEARVPFTDHRIVEYLFTLPDDYKIDWKNESLKASADEMNISEIDKNDMLRSKILLRNAFTGKVPDSIMNRPKASFPVPFREWFADWMNDIAKETILSSPLTNDIFNSKELNLIIDTAEQAQSAMSLWPLTNICMWEKQCGIRV